MTGVSERGRRKLYFDPTFITVSQKLAEQKDEGYFPSAAVL